MRVEIAIWRLLGPAIAWHQSDAHAESDKIRFPMLSAMFLLGAYLLGGVPFGYLVAAARGVDIRTVGSGNIGATNVSRALGKGPGLAVFVLDTAKGAVPALLSYFFFPFGAIGLSKPDHAAVAGTAAILGHMFSPYLRFNGGKGVATTLGTLVALSPPVAGISLGAFIVAFCLTRFVSLASLVAIPAMIASGVVFHPSKVFLLVTIALGVGVAFKHRDNIRRLLKGEEAMFSFGSNRADKGTNGSVVADEHGRDDEPDR